MFKNAIVKRPCRAMVDGIAVYANAGKPDYYKALKQHDAYIKALEKTGVAVRVLDADEAYPDSCFVEDVAVITSKCAVITNPGASSRKGETQAILPVIKEYFPEEKIKHMTAPATLEGGDVMMVGDYFYIGLSKRTNQEGVDQFISILRGFGLDGEGVPLKEILHLKTGVDYIENNNMLLSGEFIGMETFQKYNKFIIPKGEEYASNCVWMNGYVLVPAGYPKTLECIVRLGYEPLVCDVSEFGKIDGGPSCLSLRF